MSASDSWRWLVLTRAGETCRQIFPTFEHAEQYARRYVEATLRDTGRCLPAEIDRDLVPVAWVRADGLGRVWTDMVADAAGGRGHAADV